MYKKFCNEINTSLVNKLVSINGWVQNKKHLKNIIFFDFRDSYSTIQLVFLKKDFKENFNDIKNISIESCINIIGYVKYKNLNKECDKNLEILVKKYFIIGISDKLPINIFDKNLSDNSKLKYRYLYLRNHNNSYFIKLRSEIIWNINYFMRNKKFLYIETPILSKPLIEGARNYLVESRIYPKKFFSLSQSPQIFKQLLMISGFSRYYQFAKCFRDEDLRKNRQPEFTQLDIESCFVDENFIINLSNKLIKFLFKKINNLKINNIESITYNESILKFGTDKPDLRNQLVINNFINILIENNIFIDNINKFIYFICVNNEIDNLIINKFITKYKNLLNIYLSDKNNLEKTIKKFILNNFDDLLIDKIKNILLNYICYNKSIIFFVGNNDILFEIGFFIKEYSNKYNLIDKNKLSIIWIKDFPLFKINKFNKFESMHHPFTSPKYIFSKEDLLNNPEKIISNSYDLVINGYEVASGSVRINNKNIQDIIFDILDIPKKIKYNNFGFFLESLKYGTPNHSGIAFGLDRLIMILSNTNDIKDVIAFPKSTSSYDFMMNSPSIKED